MQTYSARATMVDPAASKTPTLPEAETFSHVACATKEILFTLPNEGDLDYSIDNVAVVIV